MTHAIMSDSDITSIHVSRAVEGEPESVSWLVERFDGMLRAHARWRIQRGLGAMTNEQDLVQETWLRALPKIDRIEPRDGRITPVLVRFLGKILINVCFEIQRSALREATDTPLHPGCPRDRKTAGVVTEVLARERRDAVLEAIEGLDAVDRSLLMLRGIEDAPNSVVATTLGLTPSTATRRYQSALESLRQRLPDTLFGDLFDR